MSRIAAWSDWMGRYWNRIRNAWSLARLDVEPVIIEKALRSPYNQLLRDPGVERIGYHVKPFEKIREPGGEGIRKPWGVPYAVLRTFARKNWAMRACVAVRVREVAGADWRIVPDLDNHKAELDTLQQLVVAANRIPERKPLLEKYRPQWISRKMAQQLIEATTSGDLTEGELKYRFRLAYLDLMIEAEHHAAPVRKLMRHPNGTKRTWDDMLRPLVEDLLQIGIGAWELRRAAESSGNSRPDGKILEVHWLDAATLRPVINEYGDYKGDLDPQENSWEQWIDDQRVGPGFRTCDIMPVMEFPQSDVVFRGYPYSRTETLINTLELDARGDRATLEKYRRETYGKALHMKGIMGMNSQEDLDAYRAYYEEEFEGTYKMPILVTGKDGDVKGVDLAMNPGTGDKNSVEQQKQFTIRTCAVMDVPPFKIGITEDVNRATALVSGDIADEGLETLLGIVETSITRGIVYDFGHDDIKAVAYRDNDDDSETLAALQQEMELHLITVNDALLERGKAPLEDGDVPLNYRQTFYETKAQSDAQPQGMGDEMGLAEGEATEEPGAEGGAPGDSGASPESGAEEVPTEMQSLEPAGSAES